MKHFIVAAALSFALATSVSPAMARSPAAEQSAPAKAPAKAKTWKKGGKYTGRGETVKDYRTRGLQTPGKGQRWVRDGSTLLLIDIAKGTISAVRSGSGH